ncbi:hypothetical protein JCM5353_006289 [Sporobolomyces roseus]
MFDILASWLSNCFNFASSSSQAVALPLESRPPSPPHLSSSTALANQPTRLNEDGTKSDCIFCGVTTANPDFNVVHEDDEFVIFRDRSPGSKVHLLAIPKRHIDNVKTLSILDTDMLLRMKSVGQATLSKIGVPQGQQRLGFHIPPFFSVNHLHLHLLSLPLPFPGSIKYRPSIPSSFNTPPTTPSTSKRTKLKGFAWFCEIDQVIRILQAGQKVKVGSVKTQSTRT